MGKKRAAAALAAFIVATLFTFRATLRSIGTDPEDVVPERGTLVSMRPPNTILSVQNLDADRAIDMIVTLTNSDGSVARSLEENGGAPYAPRQFDLAALSDLDSGIYSATITGTGRIAAAAQHVWPLSHASGGADLASSASRPPGRDVIVPYLAFDAAERSEMITVLNTDSEAAASVDVMLYPTMLGDPIWTVALVIPPGGSSLLDLKAPGASDRPDTFEGHARIVSDRPISVTTFLVAGRRGETAVAALSGIPIEAASPRLITAFGGGYVVYPDSRLALVNVGRENGDVLVEYHPNVDPVSDCTAVPREDESIELAAGMGAIISQPITPDSVSDGLCFGTVTADSGAGSLVGAYIGLGRGSSGYLPSAVAAVAFADAAKVLSLPGLTWRRDESEGGRGSDYTFVSFANAMASPTAARFTLFGHDGLAIDVLSEVIAPLSSKGLPVRTMGEVQVEGAGLVTSDVPLSAVGSSGDSRGIAGYGAVPLDDAGSTAHIAFVSRAPAWPTEPAWLTATPAGTPGPTPIILPTLPPPMSMTTTPPRLLSRFEVPPISSDAGSCCRALVATAGGEILAVDTVDGVGNGVLRISPDGRVLQTFEDFVHPDRIALDVDGGFYVLGSAWADPSITRHSIDGEPAGGVYLPVGRELDIQDLAVAGDGTLWLVDNRGHEVIHIDPSGEILASWSFRDALRYFGDGGFRIALSRDDSEVYVLSWTRVLRFSAEGRFVGGWGAEDFDDPAPFDGPQDIRIDSHGRVYDIDGTGRIHVFTSDGQVVTSWSAFETADGELHLNVPLAIGLDDTIVTADQGTDHISIFAPLEPPSGAGRTATPGEASWTPGPDDPRLYLPGAWRLYGPTTPATPASPSSRPSVRRA